ncbi:MAG: glycosyltransferase [Phycisphaeraceae bacterium]|nr:glycosyltransferase [Phycisphaeraceae bacterium]
MRILVLGYIVRCPLGGMAWHYLQYALGLRQLGHDVFFFEDSDLHEACCYDPSRHAVDEDPTFGLAFSDKLFREVGLEHRWAYFDGHRNRWHGPRAHDAVDIARFADVLINISGSNPIRSWHERVPVRAFIDTDPVFEQIRQLTVPDRLQRAQQHTHLFTFGLCIPAGTAQTPNDGHAWLPTRQPICLEYWPSQPPKPDAHYTTVMQWVSYKPRQYQGRHYGQKSDSFEPYFDLPRRSGADLELAVGSVVTPRQRLLQQGWHIADPLAVTRDVWTYRSYIQESKGVFAVAKHGFVQGRCGWFSERSATYLASGRPVITQDTGFSDHLPTGVGLLAFNDPDEAVEALRRVNADYPAHCRAARRVAEDHFESSAVLTDLLEQLDHHHAAGTP